MTNILQSHDLLCRDTASVVREFLMPSVESVKKHHRWMNTEFKSILHDDLITKFLIYPKPSLIKPLVSKVFLWTRINTERPRRNRLLFNIQHFSSHNRLYRLETTVGIQPTSSYFTSLKYKINAYIPKE